MNLRRVDSGLRVCRSSRDVILQASSEALPRVKMAPHSGELSGNTPTHVTMREVRDKTSHVA
ncbi:MAG: hypothetical protein DRO87_08320 [Candidatus Thorarchaeota archaeon]|nr:MAG: hypothetical protein DRP09_10670 [Candidatus Thorarchaeota archaeon]RLI56091.1 MAG: hypothetical protein DRO87_08320 [Candidatus Thorarchaeota archaeon]